MINNLTYISKYLYIILKILFIFNFHFQLDFEQFFQNHFF